MIHSAVNYITARLNQYLKKTYHLNENLAVISNIAEPGGGPEMTANNKIAVYLVNVKKDTTPGYCPPLNGLGLSDTATLSPPLHLVLFLMFTANFGGENYPESLKFLSQVIRFFQQVPVFTHDNSPDLDPGIDKLILDIENLDTNDLSSLWNIINGKYMPSILYRVRMLTIDSRGIRERLHTVSDIEVHTKPDEN